MSLSFPLVSLDQREGQWDRTGHSTARRGAEGFCWDVREGAFYVAAMMRPEAPEGRRFWGKVEWNPSRVVDPEGWGLASVEEAVAVTVPRALAAARTRMQLACDASEARVKRLDVAKDFEVGDGASVVIRSLSAVHRPWSRLNLVHADPKRNGAQTLMVGSRSGGVVRLYDKAEETHGDAPEGTVRFETEARSAWCDRYGSIRALGDVTSDSCEALGRERFGWSAMGAEVASSVSRLVHVVMAEDSLSSAEKTYFLGFLLQQSAGFAPVGGSRSLAKYRKLQRDLGIVSADVSDTVEIVRRLDWDSGREVLRVA